MATTKEPATTLGKPFIRATTVPGAKMSVAELRDALDTPKMQAELQRIADKTVQLLKRLDSDFSVAAPRSGDADGHAVSDWLARYEEHFVRILAELFVDASGNGTAEQQTTRMREARETAEMVLPQVLPELRKFALGRVALRWGASKYPNFIVMGHPEYVPDAKQWRIPLEYARIQKRIGQIVLDDEGNVLTEATTTRQQVREVIRSAA